MLKIMLDTNILTSNKKHHKAMFYLGSDHTLTIYIRHAIVILECCRLSAKNYYPLAFPESFRINYIMCAFYTRPGQLRVWFFK